MTQPDGRTRDAIDALLHATILLEQIIPGCVVDELDGLRHIRYGRPKRGVEHEIIADNTDLADARAIVTRHPEITLAYLSTFTSLSVDADTDDDSLSRVVRTTLMAYRLPDVTPFADPTLRRLTDPDDLRTLAQVRGDGVLDVDHFSDAIGCYVLDVEGEPVSSALLIPSLHDTGVIEHVHTLVAYRRRGYGRWLLRALHGEAARMGLRQTVLGSNNAGLPLYHALGYEPLCYQDVYLVGTHATNPSNRPNVGANR